MRPQHDHREEHEHQTDNAIGRLRPFGPEARPTYRSPAQPDKDKPGKLNDNIGDSDNRRNNEQLRQERNKLRPGPIDKHLKLAIHRDMDTLSCIEEPGDDRQVGKQQAELKENPRGLDGDDHGIGTAIRKRARSQRIQRPKTEHMSSDQMVFRAMR